MSSKAGIPFATNMGTLTVTRCESAARYVCVLATLSMTHASGSEIPIYMYSVSGCSNPQLQSVSPDRQYLWMVYLQPGVQWYSSSLH